MVRRLRIPGQSTIAASELALAAVWAAPLDGPLILPTRIRHVAAGAEASVAQLIVTWAQRAQPRRLETFIDGPASNQVHDLVRRLAGLVGALCADEVSGSNPDINLTEAVVHAALARLDDLGGRRPATAYRGPSAEIVCADHLGRGSPYLLYQSRGRGGVELRSREEFRALAAWLFRRSVPSEYGVELDLVAPDAIGGMLYEVLKNTEDHALVDVRGNVLSTSIRALKTNRFDIVPAE